MFAAGYCDDDVKTQNPAHIDDPITAAANNGNNQLAYFSWLCTGVDAFAPNYEMSSAITGSDSGYAKHFGTTVPTPPVGGVLAVMLQHSRSCNVEQQVVELTSDCDETGSLETLRDSPNSLQGRCKAGDRDNRCNRSPRSSESCNEPSLDPKYAAVQAAKARGLPGVAAAGNSGVGVNKRSPTHSDDAITVAAYVSWFCTWVDAFAPDYKVNSVTTGSDSGYAEYSGTPMATTDVDGIMGLRLQHNQGRSTGQQVAELTTDRVETGPLEMFQAAPTKTFLKIDEPCSGEMRLLLVTHDPARPQHQPSE